MINKESLILESYEILLKNFESNKRSYSTAIGKMAKLNLDVAIEMWEHLLKTYPEHCTGEENWESFFITTSVMGSIREFAGIESCLKILKENKFIQIVCYKESADTDWPMGALIWEAIVRSDFELAYECLELLNQNTKTEEPINRAIDWIVQAFKDEIETKDTTQEWQDTTVELLFSILGIIENETWKAQITVQLIDFM